MHDLKERLELLADNGTPRGAADVMRQARHSLDCVHGDTMARPVPRGRARTGVMVAPAILVIVVVVASAVVLVNRGSETPTIVRIPPATPDLGDLSDTSMLPPESDGVLYLVPSALPEGMQALRVQGGDAPDQPTSRSGIPDVDRRQLWVKLDSSGTRPVASFTVQWGPGATAVIDLPGIPERPPTDDPLAAYRSQSTTETVRGRLGLYANDRNLGPAGATWLVWEEPAGQMVGVMGDPSYSLDELRQIAEGLEPRADGGFTVSDPPDGYVLAAETPGMRAAETNPRDLIYRDASGRAVRIRIVDDTEIPPGTNLQVAGPNDADPHLTMVRGRHAVISSKLSNGSGGGYDGQTLFLEDANVYVQWLEPKNVLVTVSAVGLSEGEVLAIARGLQIVDQAGWDRLMVQAPGRSGSAAAATGSHPPFQGTDAEIANAFTNWLDATSVDDVVASIEGGPALRSEIEQAQAKRSPTVNYSGRVDAVRVVGDDRAFVTFSILTDDRVMLGNQQGAAVRVNGRWLVNRSTYCAIIGMGGVVCPTS